MMTRLDDHTGLNDDGSMLVLSLVIKGLGRKVLCGFSLHPGWASWSLLKTGDEAESST